MDVDDDFDDSGIFTDDLRPLPVSVGLNNQMIQLRVVENPDDRSRAPFFSRAGSWAYLVDWLASENPSE